MSNVSDYILPDKAPDPPPEDSRSKSRAMPDDMPVPSNTGAEKTILGSILLDNSYFSEAAEYLQPEDFFLDSNRRIFTRMAELMDSSRQVDIVTLSHELDKYKEVEAIGGVAYLASLTEGLPRRPKIDEYIRILKDKSQLRRMMVICNNVIARAADQAENAIDILESAESDFLEIAQEAHVGKLRTVADAVEDAGGVDEYLKPIVDPAELTGLKTGLIDYDRLTGGLQEQELTVWAARPSMGKTGLLGNVFENICLGTDKVGALFSLEMSEASMQRRLMASIARVDVNRAMRGEFLSTEEKRKLHDALGLLVESKLYIDDSPNLSPTQMRAKARRLKQREGRLDVIGVDYLQLMNAGKKFQNRQEEVSHISRSLKQMAKELECPVIALAQLNRGNESRQDKRPQLADLRESGQIEQDADVVAFIHRDEYYRRDDEDVKGLADLIVAKQRNGATDLVKLAFLKEIVRFDNLRRI